MYRCRYSLHVWVLLYQRVAKYNIYSKYICYKCIIFDYKYTISIDGTSHNYTII